jgi:hypothetical protein
MQFWQEIKGKSLVFRLFSREGVGKKTKTVLTHMQKSYKIKKVYYALLMAM